MQINEFSFNARKKKKIRVRLDNRTFIAFNIIALLLFIMHTFKFDFNIELSLDIQDTNVRL